MADWFVISLRNALRQTLAESVTRARVLFSLTEAGRVPLTGARVNRKIFGTSEHWGSLTELETSGGSAD